MEKENQNDSYKPNESIGLCEAGVITCQKDEAECVMCQETLKDESTIYEYDEKLYCSIKCIKENCGHLTNFNEDNIGKYILSLF